MPIRVRCRCGQELVLRYGEWVYVFLGLALLSLLVNLLVLILLFLRVEDVRSGLRPEAPEPAAAPVSPRGDDAAAPGPRPPSSAGGEARAAPETAPAGPAPGPGAGEAPRPLRRLDPAPVAIPGPTEDGAGASVEPSRPGPPGRAPAPDAELPVLPWSAEPPLVRLLLLEAPGAPLPPEAFLSDADGVVRARAARRAAETSPRTSARRALLELARASLEGDPAGRELLARIGSEGPAPSDPGAPGAALLDLVPPARRLLDEPRTLALREYLRAAETGGADLVILLDASRSMGPRLARLRDDVGWVLAAAHWAIPNSRLGAVVYRDDIERVIGFEADRASLAEAIRDTAADGGGDVPEGVHVALRAALSLGRFDWRPDGLKSLVVVADAPPPWRERRSSILLAGQAFRQGGYRTHAVFDEDADGAPKAPPFFPELARAGGGGARRISDPARIGDEILLAAFPSEAHAALGPLVGVLRSSF